MPSALPAVLFERYHVSVFRFFRRIIRDPDAAEDLTQELFLRVVRDADRSRPLHSEAAWVFRIARHVLADHVRAGQGGEYELSVADPENVGQEPGQLLAFSLREALDLLSPTEREMLLLCEVAGLSYAEIAEAYETSLDAVRCRLYRARGQMKELLAGRRPLPRSAQGERP